VKPGELERNLSRLVEAARMARERLAAMEHDLAELRHEMESLAAQPTQPAREAGQGEGAGEWSDRPDRGDRGDRNDRSDRPTARPEGNVSGREVGSE
jgi:hypothetical protein